MYFGSVKFFKHLIIGTICLMIIIPTTFTISLITQNDALKQKMGSAQTKYQQLEGNYQKVSKELAGMYQSEASFEYQKKYPDLYVAQAPKTASSPKTAYLTIDDGPSDKTGQYLEILAKYNAKATFFVTGQTSHEDLQYMKMIVEQGHTLAVHTYSHNYKQIYSSVDAYLEDFYNIYTLIYETTGVKPTIFRFPGGSINNYNRDIYQQIIAEMTRRGFIYYDWNVSSGDASTSASSASIVSNVLNTYSQYENPIILLHDGKTTTLGALEQIVSGIAAGGYKMDKMDNSVKQVSFGYKN